MSRKTFLSLHNNGKTHLTNSLSNFATVHDVVPSPSSPGSAPSDYRGFGCPGPSGPPSSPRCPNTRSTACPGLSRFHGGPRVFQSTTANVGSPTAISTTSTFLGAGWTYSTTTGRASALASQGASTPLSIYVHARCHRVRD